MPALPSALTPHILVVDDDNRLRSLLRRYLGEQGFVVSTAVSAADAREKFKHLAYDLMVLDVMMPGESGFDLTKSLRGATHQLPILLLTARGESSDRIEGFEVGADDYLQKPFEPRELVLRINAILRRTPKPSAAPSLLRFGVWHYDIQRDELHRGDEVVRLTDMEAGLMRLLAATPGVAMSREALSNDAAEISDRTIDVQVTRLRRKIETDPKNPRYLVTVRGEGYMLMPDADI
jgi:two-component system phosphate regulon response regulator OmpR